MSCKHLKQDLPLLVGQDLEPEAEAALRRHIVACPECRPQWQKLNESANVLREAAAVVPVVLEHGSERSLRSSWPEVQARLVIRERSPEHRMAGWFPVSVMAAACAFLAFISSSTPVFDFDGRQDFGDLSAHSSEFSSGFDAQGSPYASSGGLHAPSDWAELPASDPFSSRPLATPSSNWQHVGGPSPNTEMLQRLHWDHRSW